MTETEDLFVLDDGHMKLTLEIVTNTSSSVTGFKTGDILLTLTPMEESKPLGYLIIIPRQYVCRPARRKNKNAITS